MLFSILRGNDIADILISLVLSLPVILFALSIHEAAHGYAAYKCGDGTAKAFGRLTINPLRHLDPMGVLCMLLVGFGWAKPVPVNTSNFRNRKWGMAISAAAGPLSNLLMGAVSAVFYGFFVALYTRMTFTVQSVFVLNIVFWTAMLCLIGAQVNFVFAVFNLIPVPPFDGSRLALAFLPTKAYFGLMRYEKQILLTVLVILVVTTNIFNFSPFGWIADQLIALISGPVSKASLELFLKLA